jgi:hypothetical protein
MRYLKHVRLEQNADAKEHLQLITVLPDVIQAHDVGVVQQLHDAYLALQAKRNDLATGIQGGIILGAFDEVGQTQSSYLLGCCFGYNLCRTKLSRSAVTDKANARASATADGPTQLPRANVRLPAAGCVGGVGACIGDSRVTLGVVGTGLVAHNSGDAFVLWSQVLLGGGGVPDNRLRADALLGRKRRIVAGIVLVRSVLGVRILVGAEGSIPKDASAGRRPPMVVVIHGRWRQRQKRSR